MVAQGVTVLVSTAYMDEAERCDHVALLDQGRLLALDRPAALQHSLDGQMLALRTADSRKAVRLLRETPGVRRAAIFGDSIHLTLASRERDWPRVQGALSSGGIDVAEVHDMEPSLEDVFIDRVAGGAEAA
jgi:ABC-2 type transport system ATP-binding protein